MNLAEHFARLHARVGQGEAVAAAEAPIPALADWCVIDIFENGELRHATVAHRDPAKADLANELSRNGRRSGLTFASRKNQT